MSASTKTLPPANLARRLNHVARLINREFDRRLAPLGVNVAYLPVLGALNTAQALSQKELAELAGIGQPAMAQMLDRMVKEGLLQRTADSVDRRKVIFSLSERASGRMGSIGAEIKTGNDDVFAVLEPEGQDRLSSLLMVLEIHLETKK
ncbi:MarR family transcriptional regulator [Agrobacterium sp. SORGH_AS 787]|uniref:MarR family winged helix-turn-helix transcriptional regulator n=1 Tax=Agrobacterium sp. SORGH_AS 787 TaxID=3041775 RepID=UPI002782F9AF|nr:DNA-binding MarR family transcriptional regulator [Rhizobium sp. SORGH_AS_0787]